ncbi:hypothetical protein HK105_208256 [Polyrhizophydium stewartii]|uniref:Ankyrin repeat protein n=1 Tax=Polyrhizophydium stewartii TaxID=2732419 RepID=A0ABR4MYG4_9FUNG
MSSNDEPAQPAEAASAAGQPALAADAPTTDAPLPPGASHWDRIPHELHEAVIAFAGPLTLLTTGGPHPAQVRRLRSDQCERIWADVVELDWDGDLASLPVMYSAAAFVNIRSRRLLKRLRELTLINREMHHRVAIRNNWLDMLDPHDARAIMRAVCAEGNIQLAGKTIKSTEMMIVDDDMVKDALRNNQFELAKYLRRHIEQDSCPVMESAAHTGNIEFVVWAHESCECQYENAVHTAIKQGHVDLVDFLLSKCEERDGVHDISTAVEHGQAEILELLYNRMQSVFVKHGNRIDTSGAFDLDTLEWLRDHDIAFDAATAMQNVADRGTVDAFRWLRETYALPATPQMLVSACCRNSLPLVKYMINHAGAEIDDQVIEQAISSSTDTLKVLLLKQPSMTHVAANLAAAADADDLLDWMRWQFPGCITQITLESAIAHSSRNAVEYLLDCVCEVEWDLEVAMAVETSAEMTELLKAKGLKRR